MKVLVVCKHPEDSQESEACKLIQKEGFDITYSWKNTLSKENMQDTDLIIAIGGDGTTLSASHFISEKPLLSVNSSPHTSEGALTTIPYEELEQKLEEIKGKIETEKLERIKISINGKPISLLALNEIFIANEKAYLISKYKLKFKDKEEIQKSSGLIFSTGTGSTAWFKSAGGKPFSPQERFIKMIVREPYKRNLLNPEIEKLTVKENEFVEIIPLTDSILAIDSIREIKLNKGDIVRIEISEFPLLRVK